MKRIARALLVLGIAGQAIVPGCTSAFLAPSRDAAVASFTTFLGAAVTEILVGVFDGTSGS